MSETGMDLEPRGSSYQRLFESATDAILLVALETGRIIDVNPSITDFTQYQRGELSGRLLQDLPVFSELPFQRLLADLERQETVRYYDLVLHRKDGSAAFVDLTGTRITVGEDRFLHLNLRNTAYPTEAQKAIQESEERFHRLVESLHDYAVFQMDISGRITSWNAGAERILGWTSPEILGRNAALLFTPEDRERGVPEKEIQTAVSTGRAEDEHWHLRKDGSRFFASGVLTALRDGSGQITGFAKVMRDITERKEREEQLNRALQEKNELVREIHHRVKNNLQMILSLLSLEAHHSRDPVLEATLEQIETRVRAIVRIHEQLYSSQDFSAVEFGSYLGQLARELIQPRAGEHAIALDLQVEDIVVGFEQAVPLGLIASELITNSLKHGLNGDQSRITVTLSYQRDVAGNLTGFGALEVCDNRPGFAADAISEEHHPMGLRLVSLLARQLHAKVGKMVLERGSGWNLTFPLNLE